MKSKATLQSGDCMHIAVWVCYHIRQRQAEARGIGGLGAVGDHETVKYEIFE